MVKKIIVNLARNVKKGVDTYEWDSLPVEEFLKIDGMARTAVGDAASERLQR